MWQDRIHDSFSSGATSTCINGTLAEDYSSLGMTVDQVRGSDVVGEWLPGDFAGVSFAVTRNVPSGLRLELIAADGTGYCVPVTADEGTYRWSRFRTECWGSGGVSYDPGTPIERVQFYVPGDVNSAVSYDYCIDELAPTEDVGFDPDHKFVGNITTAYDVRPDFIDYWDQITPENEGKWSSFLP